MSFNRHFLIFLTIVSSFGVLCQTFSDENSTVTDLASVNNYKKVKGLGKDSDNEIVVGLASVNRYQMKMPKEPSETSKKKKKEDDSSTSTQNESENQEKESESETPEKEDNKEEKESNTSDENESIRKLKIMPYNPVQRRLKVLKSKWIPGKPVYLRDRYKKAMKSTENNDKVSDNNTDNSGLNENIDTLKDRGQGTGLNIEKNLIL